MQIYEFRLNFTEVWLQGSNWQYIPALVQINPWLGAGQQKAIILLYIVFGSVCTSSKQNIHIFKTCEYYIDVDHIGVSNHWLLNSTVCSTGDRSVTDGFPSQKASNAAFVGPILVQHWHSTIGVTLCKRWPNVSGPTLGQLTNPRWPNVGEPTLAQRKGWRWPNVAMLAGLSPSDSVFQ